MIVDREITSKNWHSGAEVKIVDKERVNISTDRISQGIDQIGTLISGTLSGNTCEVRWQDPRGGSSHRAYYLHELEYVINYTEVILLQLENLEQKLNKELIK